MTNNSIRLFEVGGSIRDELMGNPNPLDRDFCAESPGGWEALSAWCHDNMQKVFLVTPEFFTVRGFLKGVAIPIDVVMCRKDGASSDGRHPDEVKPGTLLDDLSRRDFTVNTMAREVDPSTLRPIGDIIDPFKARADLGMRRLVSVGNAQKRFDEDNLRLIRAVRFMITKGFVPDSPLERMIADPENWKKMMGSVSIDRVRGELHKALTFSTPATLRVFSMFVPVVAFDTLFDDTGLWLKPTLEKQR
tara:strand:+ start:1194 stop:1934 length:741 start_codon:yes stop_codon:yes gene_type:complete